MTNKPMLSVERELLERVATEANYMLGFTSASNYDECRDAVDELRALLDKPVVESEADRLQRRCKNAELALKVQTENYEALKAAQHQREPVYMVRDHGSCCWEEMSGESLELCQAQPAEYELRKLYAEQSAPVATATPFFYALMGPDGKPYYEDFCVSDEPSHLECVDEGVTVVPLYLKHAPVAVVMPERQKVEDGEQYLQEDFVSGWNACLDAADRLNGVKP